MKIKESLYIKILIWVYERQESGFMWEDLKNEFNLNYDQEQWLLKVFKSNMPSSENLIDHIYNQGKNEHKYFITAKGTSTAVDYLNLKESKKSSRRAEIIALMAVAIGVIVGIVQILISLES